MAVKIRWASLMLLLLVGTQLAASKSVDERLNKDDEYKTRTLILKKRAVNKEGKQDATTLPSTESTKSNKAEEATPIWVITTTKAPKTRKRTIKSTTAAPTTTPEYDDEETSADPESEEEENEEEEEPATVKPLNIEKDKPTKSQKRPKPSASTPPSIMDRINPEEETPAAKKSSPEEPASKFLPPMPNNNNNQRPYNGFHPQLDPGFAPYGLHAQPAPYPQSYNYPYPSGPAFSSAGAGAGVGSSAFAGGFASASASASGTGGSVSTSTSPGGGFAQQSSSSFSRSYPGGENQASFIGTRGSFGDDDDSVGIEVNGPSGVPPGISSYSSSQPIAISGPGYSASASGSYRPGPNPYMNSIPNYGAINNPVDLQNFFQYFAALQAQQQAFQRQLQAQILAQQQAIWDQANRVDSNFGVPGGSLSSGPQSASASANLGPKGGFQTAQINPAAPGIFSRFGESIPPPSGNSYGVFSSSSSSSSLGPDGKQVSRKTATVGVNDNGKISYKTVHDP